MFCPNCGAQVPQASATCPSCGMGVAAPSAAPAPAPQGLAAAPRSAVVQASVDPNVKSKVVAGLLGIFLGGLGVHRFYLGYTRMGVIQLVVSIATCGLGSLWGLVEGILIIAGSSITTDAAGRALRD